MCSGLKAPGRRATTLSVPTARSLDTSGMIRAEPNPELRATLVSSWCAAAAVSLMISGLRERTTSPIAVSADLKTTSGRGLDRRSSSLHARGVGLELLAVLGEQGEPDAVAGHEPGDPAGERMEGERDVDRLREHLEHLAVQLQLLDLVLDRPMVVLGAEQLLGKPADAPRRDDGEDQHDDPRDPQLREPPRQARTPAADAHGKQPGAARSRRAGSRRRSSRCGLRRSSYGRQLVGLRHRPERPVEPQRTPDAALARCRRTRVRHPLLVHPCALFVSTSMSPYASSGRAFSRRTRWCQQCMPLTGSGCTGKVRFWCTPTSLHQMRPLSGSSLSNGCAPWTCFMT